MYRTMKTLRKSMIDQECLIDKIEQWKAEDPKAKFHFRPKCVAEKEPLEKDKSIVKTKIVTTKLTMTRYD